MCKILCDSGKKVLQTSGHSHRPKKGQEVAILATNKNNEQEKQKAFFIEIQHKKWDYDWDQGFSLGKITTYGPFKNMNDARKIMELIRKEGRFRYVFTKYKVTARGDHFGWNKIHVGIFSNGFYHPSGFIRNEDGMIKQITADAHGGRKVYLHPNGGYWRFITTNVPANKEIEWYDMDHWLQPHSTGNARNAYLHY